MVAIHRIFETGAGKHINVIFFHGLDGDSHETWGAKAKGATDEHFWPAWLERDIDGLSVHSVSYCAHILKIEGSSQHFFLETDEIYKRLIKMPELQDGSLYLVGHSLGGLVIKQLIRKAEGEALVHRREAKQFLKRVEKIVFLATPHLGADLAAWADCIPGFRELQSETADDLDRGNPHLRELYHWYCNWAKSRKIHHLAMYETKPYHIADIFQTHDVGAVRKVYVRAIYKLFGKIGVEIVDKASANPGIEPELCHFVAAKNCNHFEIAKPKSVESAVYKSVCEFLKSPAQSVRPRTAAQAPTGAIELALAPA